MNNKACHRKPQAAKEDYAAWLRIGEEALC
jgi:hypothetical protein